MPYSTESVNPLTFYDSRMDAQHGAVADRCAHEIVPILEFDTMRLRRLTLGRWTAAYQSPRLYNPR
jgi:hypothetical protein